MKKILSLTLAVLMVVSMIPTAFAAETQDYTMGTSVSYTADDEANREYTITVPASMEPGQSGTVTLKGKWASDETVKVTADANVVLTNSINAADTKTLAITFAGIEKAGDNTVEKTYTETVAVAAMPTDALFGIWSGKFNYNVELVEDTTGGDEVVAAEGSATFSDGITLSWDEVKLTENGTKYGYTASSITDTSIGNTAFMNCTQLTNIEIPKGVTNIGKSVFNKCSNLTSVIIPPSVVSIDNAAFMDCANLTSVMIPEGITSISISMFENCKIMPSVNIPVSVTNIGQSAFRYCLNLTTINYAGTKAQWNAITFGDWKTSVPATEVICSDGPVALS